MRGTAVLVISLVLVAASCGSDEESGSATTAVDETTAPAGTAPAETTPPDTAPAETTVEPETIDETSLQEALLDAQPGDVIEIPAGTFSFDRSLTLDVDGVTIRGAGMDETILSFADQVAGAEGLLVSASDFTIEDLAIEDTVGDALKVNEGENITIRGVRTEWTGPYSVDNGAYGIYPVQTSNVLIEDSVAIGASDAGIYVGQSNNVVVRNNRAEFNVAGIEIENTIGADVYGNLATNNTGGILVFNLPGLSQIGEGTRIYDNEVVSNNTENFSQPGSVVSIVPAGTGVIILANDKVEIFGNTIADNRSANVAIAAGGTVDITGEDDPNFDSYPEGIAIYDNEISGGGDDPDGIIAALQPVVLPDGGNIAGIVWDGAVDPAKLVGGAQAPTDRLCIQQPGVEVLNADAANGFAAARIEPSENYDCMLEPLPAVELPGG
jgi:parallel beta-helix repeat protein